MRILLSRKSLKIFARRCCRKFSFHRWKIPKDFGRPKDCSQRRFQSSKKFVAQRFTLKFWLFIKTQIIVCLVYLQLVLHHFLYSFCSSGCYAKVHKLIYSETIFWGLPQLETWKEQLVSLDLAYMSFGETLKVGFGFAVKITLVTLNFDQWHACEHILIAGKVLIGCHA